MGATEPPSGNAKAGVRRFWESAPCGKRAYGRGASMAERLASHGRTRAELEPYIRDFGRFDEGCGRDVLEIGVGLGADHLEWARGRPRRLVGIDLTARAVALTRERLVEQGVSSNLLVGDAEGLPFADDAFDIVWSWGVLHHTPRTECAIDEVWRVLRPGGRARMMLYHTASLVGLMLWARYGLLRLRPLIPWRQLYGLYLESPGTRAFSRAECRRMMSRFRQVTIVCELTPGDLLAGAAGQRHEGPLLWLARRVYPRAFVRRHLVGFGLALLIEGVK